MAPHLTTTPNLAPPASVLSRDGTAQGTVISSRRCQMSGCLGVALGVRWSNGQLTWPCTKGMRFDPQQNEWQIL